MSRTQITVVLLMTVAGTFLLGKFASNLHEFFPVVFSKPSAFPYGDSFVAVMSVIVTFLMIEKKAECWIGWLVIDIVATYLYFLKDIAFYGALYAVFCVLATFGFYHWITEYKSYKTEIA